VDANGLVTGKAVGSATISATLEKGKGDFAMTVTAGSTSRNLQQLAGFGDQGRYVVTDAGVMFGPSRPSLQGLPVLSRWEGSGSPTALAGLSALGASQYMIRDANAAETVIGSMSGGQLSNSAYFIWSGGSAQAIPRNFGKALITDVRAINASGQIAGQVRADSNVVADRAAILSASGSFQELPLPTGAQHAAAWDINAGSLVVGYASGGTLSDNRATIWRNGAAELIHPPNNSRSMAFALSDSGHVLISAFPGGLYLWKDGTFTPIDNTPDQFSVDVNASGQVAGTRNTQSSQRAFIWDKGVLTVLPTAGFFESATSINKSGAIAGWIVASDRTIPALWVVP
jgi:hypothetical protein